MIERSFGEWLSAWQLPEKGGAKDRFDGVAGQTAKALLDSPDFIRLGLMLALGSPLLLGASAFIFISGFSLLLIKTFM